MLPLSSPAPFPTPLELTPPPELLPLLEGVVAQAAEAAGTDHAYLYTLSRDAASKEADTLETVVVRGLFGNQLGFRLRPGEGLGGKVWESGEMLLVPEYDCWPGRAEHYPMGVVGSVMGMPLKVHGQVVGVIGLARGPGEPTFGVPDSEGLRPFAQLASLALENAGLRGEVMRGWLEHRQAEQALRLSQSRLNWHSDLIPMPLIELDLEGRVLRWNRMAEQTFGHSEAEAQGVLVHELLLAPPAQQRTSLLWKQLREHRVGGRQVQDNRTRSGQHLTCEWIVTPLLNERGQPSGLACIVQDISGSQRADERVRILEAAAMLAEDAVVITRWQDDDHRIVYANPAFERLTGYPLEQVQGQHPRFLHLNSLGTEKVQALERAVSDLSPTRTELRELRRDGSTYWCELSLLPIVDEGGAVDHWVSWRRDISERKRAELLSQGRNRLLEMLLRGADLALTLGEFAELLEGQWDGRVVLTRLREGRFQAVAAPSFAPEFLELLGTLEIGGPHSAWTVQALEGGMVVCEDILRDPNWSLLHPHAEALGLVCVWTWPIRSGAGRLLGGISVVFAQARHPQDADLTLLKMGQQLAALCIEHSELSEKLEQQTYTDTLTGLPNRAAFEREFGWTVEHLAPEAALAVLLLDLDGFKSINDACGHEVGDALLRQVAGALRPEVGAHSLFRMGGDEYALIVRGLDEAELRWLAECVLRALDRPFFVDGLELFISASIGLALREPQFDTHSSLLRAADTALYRAKAAGRNLYVIYRPQMHWAGQQRLEQAVALRRALEREELEVHYQVQVSPEGVALGVEALLRWRRLDRMVPPAVFIPIAEETGLIQALGQWVLEKACAQSMQWRQRGLVLGMAVNISALHFARPEFVDTVRGVLIRSGLPAEALELELTESIFVGEVQEIAARMQNLRDLGVRLYLDDFGTGYSSLSYLRGLPLDGLKIDRSFVQDLEHAENGLAGAIVGMARQLGLETVAEGVETPLQSRRLELLGCERLQGYLFARPMPAEAVEAMLHRSSGTLG